MDKKYKNLVINTLIFTLGSIGSKLILFILLPLYTNVLTTSEYGLAEIVTTISTLLVPLISLSVGDSVLRFGLDKTNNPQSVLKGAALVNAIGTGALLLFIPLLGLYAAIRDYIPHLIFITIFTSFRTSFQLYAKATGKNIIFSIDSIINALFLAVLNILFLVVLKWNVSGYLWAQAGSMLASLIFLFFSLKMYKTFKEKNFDGLLLKKMLRYSIPLIVNAISWWLIYSTDKLMLEYFLDDDKVGIYAVASKIPSLINTVTYFFSQAWVLSAVVEYDSSRDEEFYRKVFRIYNYFLCLSVAFVLLILKPFMQIYVGEDFVSAWLFVPFLLVATIFRNYSDFFGAFFASAKKNIQITLSTLAAASCNVVLNLVLIPKLEVQGAVIATTISFVVVGIYRFVGSRRIFKFKIYYVESLITLAVVCCQAAAVAYQWYPVIVSSLALFFVFIINLSSNIRLFNTVKSVFKRRRTKT